MLSTVFSIAFNLIMMLLIVYGFHIIGQIANNKYFNGRFKYVVPIGFGWFMVTFQVISYPFILLQTSFSLFLMALIPFGLIWLGFIFINRSHITWKIKYDKFPYVPLIIVFVSVVLGISSIVYSDSWLYAPMITSTIENNLIYSHNGLLSDIKLSIMHHRFEAYYLWQAVVAMTYRGNYLIGLITEYKILDGMLIVFSFMELGHQFKFSKLKSSLFALSMFIMLVSQNSFLDISPFQTTEPPIQLFQISTGTALFHYFIIPMAIIYLVIEKQLNYKQKNMYLLGLLFAYSSVSTTYYYTFPLYIISLLTIKHLVYKTKDYQLMLSFMTCWMLIIMSFIGVKSNNLISTIGFVIVYIIFTKGIMIIYRKLSIKAIRGISIGLIVAYIIAAITLFNPLIYSNTEFTVDKQSLRLYNMFMNFQNGSLEKIIVPEIFLLFSCMMLILIFMQKQFKPYAIYIITYSFYFLNPFALNIYKVIGIQPVISRIFAFSFIGYLIVICAFSNSRNWFIKIMLIVWVSIGAYELGSEMQSKIDSKQSQLAQITSNIGGLANYNFEEDSFIVFDNLNASYQNEVYYSGVNKLVVLNPSLSWDPKVKTCDGLYQNTEYSSKFKHCYTIYNKDKGENLEYVYETDKYLVYKNF